MAIKVAQNQAVVSVNKRADSRQDRDMKSLLILWAVALIVVCDLCSPAAAGRVALRPLSASELRSAFIESGGANSERSSDGRSISSALAGIKGFALGVKNGIGGALLFDVATSNETIAYLSNLINNLNTTLGDSGGSNNNAGTIQEVCFQSRSLDGDSLLARNNDEDDDDNEYQADDEDFYDDEEDAQVRQLDYDYEPVSNGLTCLVVNSGQAIVRHRRSLAIEKVSSLPTPEAIAPKSIK